MTLASDFKNVGAFLRKTTQDPQSFKVAIGALVGCVCLMAVEMPLAGRIESARAQLDGARIRSQDAAALDHLLTQIEVFEDRLVATADLVDWQDYVLTKLNESGAVLQVLSPETPKEVLRFQIVRIQLSATGSYMQLVDFVDRVERGERIARFEELDMKLQQGELRLDCKIVGLAGETGIEGVEADGEMEEEE